MIPSRLAARFSGLLLCGLLAGCAYEWRRPGTAPAQARRDGEECAVQAQAGARWARHYRFPPREVRRKIGDTMVQSRDPRGVLRHRGDGRSDGSSVRISNW